MSTRENSQRRLDLPPWPGDFQQAEAEQFSEAKKAAEHDTTRPPELRSASNFEHG